jgi:serine/threonine protein kinase
MMGTFREKYTVSRKLGAGGFGEVYIARRRVDKEVSLQHTFVQSICS